MDDGLSDADVFGGSTTQGGNNTPVVSAPALSVPTDNKQSGQPSSQPAVPMSYSDEDVFGSPQNPKPQAAVQQKDQGAVAPTDKADLAHFMATLQKMPAEKITGDEDWGQFIGKNVFNQVHAISPYLFDSNPDATPSDRVNDAWKAVKNNTARNLAMVPAVAVDAATHAGPVLHNAGQWAESKLTGDAPNYEPMPHSLMEAVENKYSYEPKTALGNTLGGASTLLGPGEYIKGAEAVGQGVNLLRKGAQYAGDVGKVMRSGAALPAGQDLQAGADALFAGTNDTYKAMRQNGAVYNPDSIEELRQSVNNALKNSDIIPSLRPKTTEAVQAINAAADSGDLSLNHLDQYRRMLRNASGEDSAAAGAVRQAIDSHVNQTDVSDLMSGTPEAVGWLNRGRAEYTRAANFDDVQTLLQKANGDQTKIKNMLNTFLSKDENTAGMTVNELDALRRASKTSTGEAMSKMLGKAGITILPTNAQGNGVLPYLMAAGETGSKGTAAALVPHGLPIVAAGTAARAGNTLYGRGLANDALNLIKNRELPPVPSKFEPAGLLEEPPIRSPRGGFAPGEYQGPPAATPTPLLARGDMDTYYQPQGRGLTYQPRHDWEVDANGFTDRPPNVVPSESKGAPSGSDYRHTKQDTTGSTKQRLRLTYQPREDFIGTNNGIVQSPAGEATDLLGTEQGMPMPLSEATKVNQKWPQQARGGKIKSHNGRVVKKPKSYPALEKRA